MFKVRDLLIVAAFCLGCTSVYYRSEVLKHFEPAVRAFNYYVEAPKREAEVQAKLDAVEAALSHQMELFAGAESVISRMGEDLEVARAESASLKSRYADLCQRLLELGNDVPSVLAAE